MVTPTGVAPHIPFHLGPVQPPLDTPTPTGGGENGHQPPGLAAPPGLPQPASNMSAAQQLKDRLMKGLPCSYARHEMCYKCTDSQAMSSSAAHAELVAVVLSIGQCTF